jgi:hypothetical protein
VGGCRLAAGGRKNFATEQKAFNPLFTMYTVTDESSLGWDSMEGKNFVMVLLPFSCVGCFARGALPGETGWANNAISC